MLVAEEQEPEAGATRSSAVRRAQLRDSALSRPRLARLCCSQAGPAPALGIIQAPSGSSVFVFARGAPPDGAIRHVAPETLRDGRPDA